MLRPIVRRNEQSIVWYSRFDCTLPPRVSTWSRVTRHGRTCGGSPFIACRLSARWCETSSIDAIRTGAMGPSCLPSRNPAWRSRVGRR